VIVSCPSCKAKYQYEEFRFGDSAQEAQVHQVRRYSKSPNPAGRRKRCATAVIPAGHGENRQELDAANRRCSRTTFRSSPRCPPAGGTPGCDPGRQRGQITVAPRTVLGAARRRRPVRTARCRANMPCWSPGGRGDGGRPRVDERTYVDGVRVQKAPIFSNQEFSLGTTTLMLIVTVCTRLLEGEGRRQP
jgi:hypothetical protein